MERGRVSMAKKRNRTVTLAEFNGDHGTGTLAAKAGTKLEPVTNDDGKNPNKMARRRRINRIEDMMKRHQLNMRQYQAAMEIQEAWCRVEMLSSGGELKERVQASPKPDATIDIQVSAMSRLQYVMSAVPSAMRYVIEHVCWHNQTLSSLPQDNRGNHSSNFKVALDLVANKMRY